MPAINARDVTVAIRSVEPIAPAANTGHGVTIVYRATRINSARLAEARDQRLRLLTCVFARRDGDTVPELLALATENGLIGDLRLHLLQRHWIARGHASTHDPDPVTMIDGAPELAPWAASIIQQIIAGLPSLALLGLLATAFALVYGLIGRIVFVFGELSVVGAVSGFIVFHLVGGALNPGTGIVGVVAGAMLCACAMGWAIARLMLKPLAQHFGQSILIAAIALGLSMMEGLRLLQGTSVKWLSPLFSRPIGIARSEGVIVTTTPMAAAVAIAGLAAAAGLVLFLKKSAFGRRWRAVSDDAVAARMLGIDADRVVMQSFVLAACLASLAGSLAMLHFGAAGHGSVLTVGLKALVAAILGGVGSVPGAFAGGLLLGFAEALWSTFFPIEFRDAAVYVALVLLLVLKPEGLFGRTPTGGAR